MAQTTTIPFSKAKILLLSLAAAGFVALGCFLIRKPDGSLLEHGFGVVSIVFFGIALLFALRKLFDFSPGLVLDARGLTDNSSVFPRGFIPWSDISGLSVQQIKNQRLLYVLLKNPDKYIASRGPIMRAALKAMESRILSPVAISSNTLAIGFDDMVQLINKYLLAQSLDAPNNSFKADASGAA